MSLHKNLTGDDIHTPITFVYATEADRINATGFTSEDVGKFSYVQDVKKTYQLVSESPIQWSSIGATVVTISWLDKAKDFYDPSSALPTTPTVGDRWVASATGNGWTNNYIYEWDGSIWEETIPEDGDAIILFDPDPNQAYNFNGTDWVAFGLTVDHNDLSNIQGGTTGEYYHLTQTQESDLTSGGDASTQHNHNSLYPVVPSGNVGDVTYINGTNIDASNDLNWNDTSKKLTIDGSNKYVPQTSEPSHEEGVFFYCDTDKTFCGYINNTEVKLNIGEELWAQVFNNTGETNLNGLGVYIDGVNGDNPSVDLCDATKFMTSRLVGMFTADETNSDIGVITLLGKVSDFDTSGLTAGEPFYSDPANPGGWTSTQPTGGNFTIFGGICLVSNATTGTVFFMPRVSEYTAEINSEFGFPNRTDTTMSFTNGTRTFEITPTSTDFYYYHNGDKFISTGDSVQVTDTSDLYAIYYNGDTLTAQGGLNAGIVDVLIRTQTLVAYVYWNSTDQEYYFLGDERHGYRMDGETHSRFHFVDGAQYLNGLGLTDIITNASGDVDTHAQFGVEAGGIVDENVPHFQDTDITSTTGLPIFYLSGPEANPELVRTTNAGFSVLKGTNRLYYNAVSGGNYQLIEVGSNNDFVLCHVFMWNDFRDGEKVVAFVGQNEYTSRGAAEAAAETEIDSLVTNGNLAPETVWLGTVIFQTSTGKSNAVAASIEETDDGSDYVDGRTKKIFGGGGTSPTTTSFNDELFEVFNDTDTTKKMMFEVGGITTATTRTIDIQDADGTMALLSDVEPTLKAGGLWAEGTSLKNYVYRENQWTGYPTVDTTDHLEPQAMGSPEDSVDTDSFPTTSDTSVVKMIHNYTFTEDCFVKALQVYAPNWDIETISRVTIVNNTTGEVAIIDNPILSGTDFVTLTVGNPIFVSGTSLEIWFELYNTTPANSIDGGWTSNVGTGAPISTEFNIDSVTAPTVIEISHTDLDLTSRATELDGVTAGSVVRITETQDVSRTITFEVLSVDTTAPSSTKYNIVASSVELGPKNIRDGRICTIDIDVPVTTPTEYGVRTGYYPTNNPSWGTITTELYYDGVQQSGSTDAYAINLICQKAEVSDDWFILSVSGSSGGGSGTTSPLTTKGDLYTYSTGDARLPIGNDGQILKADSSETTGLKWIDKETGFPVYEFSADIVDTPNTSDWTVNAGAALATDSNNSALKVRLFDDSTEEGIGYTIFIPADATNIIFEWVHRAETAPGSGGIQTAQKYYFRRIPDNAAVGTWDSEDALLEFDIPQNENWQYDSHELSLAGMGSGITAGSWYQFELTRDTGDSDDDLSGDWAVLKFRVRFS